MHAYYDYRAATTPAQILQDVVKLLTGTTDKTQLSPACILENTEIISVVPAGWVLYDDGGDATTSVMLASNIDVSNFNGTQAQLDASVAAGRTSANSKFMLVSITGSYICFRPCESATTNRVMINECYRVNGDSDGQKIHTSTGGVLRINASARHAAMYSMNRTKDAVGNGSSYSPSGVFERTRRSGWDTNASAYPVTVLLAGGTHIGARPSFPRIRGIGGTDLTGTLAAAQIGTTATGSVVYNGCDSDQSSDAIKSLVKTTDGSLKHMFRPLWPSVPKEAFIGGDISAFADFWQTTPNIGNIGDTIVCGGKTYELWASGTAGNGIGTGFRYVVRMG